MNAARSQVLVAGLGNVFLGDDAFGVEVIARLRAMALPPSVRLMDVGTRGLHLMFELLDGAYASAILIDVVSRGGAPGTLYVLEPEHSNPSGEDRALDAHALAPHRVLAYARQLGGDPGRVMILGCEPSGFRPDDGMSGVVRAAVDKAARIVLEMVAAASTGAVAAAEV